VARCHKSLWNLQCPQTPQLDFRGLLLRQRGKKEGERVKEKRRSKEKGGGRVGGRHVPNRGEIDACLN